MADAVLRSESPTEYFGELVESALQRQHLAAGRLTSYYLVNLLAGFVRSDTSKAAGEPLGIRLAEALQAAGARQRDGLRQVGDLSLFISGFFADSLNRRLVDVDYYIQLGECAYGSLARTGDAALGDVFDELSAKFPAFVDVLTEVSERTATASNTDLLRLYEKWVRTRSRRTGDILASKGIVPNASVGSRFIQWRVWHTKRGLVTIPDELADEARSARKLRQVVDIAATLLRQSRLSQPDAERFVAVLPAQVRTFFPGAADNTDELI